MKVIWLAAVFAIWQVAWAQVINPNTGLVTPMILMVEGSPVGLHCFDEDPDTGDRVYGGNSATGNFLGFKDGTDTATIGDPTVWKWSHIDFLNVDQMYYCKFTPEKVASTGNNRMIATIEGNTGSAFLGAALWMPKIHPTAGQLAL